MESKTIQEHYFQILTFRNLSFCLNISRVIFPKSNNMPSIHQISRSPQNITQSNSAALPLNSKSTRWVSASNKKNLYILLLIVIIIILIIMICLTVFFVLKLRLPAHEECQTQDEEEEVEHSFILPKILVLKDQKKIQQQVLNSNLSISESNSNHLLNSLLNKIYNDSLEDDLGSYTVEAALKKNIEKFEKFTEYIKKIKFPEEELVTKNSSLINLLIILRWVINFQNEFLSAFSLILYSLPQVQLEIREQSYGLFYFYLASREFLGNYLQAEELFLSKGAVYLEEYLETIPYFTNEESEYFKLKRGVEKFFPFLLCSKNFTYEANLNGDSESTKFEFDLLIKQIEVFKSLMYFHQLWICEILFEGIFEKGNLFVLRKSIFKGLLETKDLTRKRKIKRILDYMETEEMITKFLKGFRVWASLERKEDYIVAQDGRKVIDLHKNVNLGDKIFSVHDKLLTNLGELVQLLLG